MGYALGRATNCHAGALAQLEVILARLAGRKVIVAANFGNTGVRRCHLLHELAGEQRSEHHWWMSRVTFA
jgi:hypothetical protein